MLTGLLAKATPAPAPPHTVAHHIHIPGLGYWVLLILGIVIGFILGRVWDEAVAWLFDTTAIVRRWVEAALVVVGFVAALYAVMHWGFHQM